MIKVILVDHHQLLLDGLEKLLSVEPDIQVVATCTTGPDMLRAVAKHDPDVLVLDIQMPSDDDFGVLRELSRMNARTRVVVLAAALTDDDVLSVVRLGARGLVLKQMPARLLMDCIRQVHIGGLWLERQATARALETLIRGRIPTGGASLLTSRQAEIVRLASRGLRNKEIAERLNIAEGTVKNHLHHIYEKLSVGSRVKLSLLAEGGRPAARAQ